ncbi:MAG TPA: adenylosuccinate lyase [Spirochaetes bacterium]|nr:adenylosuccinate lyase [Spirochaetota bacterium]
MQRDIFSNISPLDARYYKSSPELMDALSIYFSENSVIRYEAAVEAAIMVVMERHGLVPTGSGEQMKKASGSITPEEVYDEEEKTKHNIRALVNVLQRYVDKEVAPYIHLTATSEDITGTAGVLRMRDGFYKVVIPNAINLMDVLLDIAVREAGTVQIGRTHGQHAVPVTVGYLFSGYVDRFGERLLKIVEAVENLRGKMSGAVGAYNASSLLFEDPRKFEEEVLAELDLEPAGFSSQIIEPEYQLDLMHGVVSAFGVLAQISDDMRHLQRTEIGELGERFEKGQVGSSTMPHKRNPWNFEHVKSLWKEFYPRMLTRYSDQLSDHQRDLTNSASNRFTVEVVTAFTLAMTRLTKPLKKLVVDYSRLKENLSLTGGMFLAEPLYILLASKGIMNAHELVKRVTLKAEKENISIFELIKKDSNFDKIAEMDAWKNLEKDPANYTGKSKERALEISQIWKKRTGLIKKNCEQYRVIQKT